jgi:hypothetical protein
MQECQVCQHDVVSHFALQEKHHRFWMDLDQKVLFGSGIGESLRQIAEQWSATVEGSVGLRPLNERINQIEPLVSSAHQDLLSKIPPVIQLDGMWITIQSSQEPIKEEKRKRKRKTRTGKKMVLLAALGFWPDGRWEILDWQMTRSEDHQEWEVLVQRLWERGCQPENGWQLVVRDGSGGLGEALALVDGATVPAQRCLFHPRQNVSKKSRTERKGKENQERRKLRRSPRPKMLSRRGCGSLRGASSGASWLRKPLRPWNGIVSRPCVLHDHWPGS